MPIDVASYLKFTPTDNTGSFAADAEGHVYYDDSDSQLKHYDGSEWVKVNTRTNVDRPGDGEYSKDSYTSLLIHSNTSNGNTTFTDSSSNNHTMTVGNDAKHSTVQAKIGTTSIFIDGTSHLSAAHSSELDFDDEFTVDLWFWQSEYGAIGDNRFFQKGANEETGYHVLTTISSDLIFGGFQGASMVGWTEDLTDSTWYHLAFTRQSDGYLRLWLDGILKATSAETQTRNLDYVGALYIAAYPGAPENDRYSGYIDEFRVSKGIARWTSNFTVY